MRRVAIVALACAALAGCADMARNLNPVNWFSSAPTGPKPAALPVLSGAQAARTLWQASLGAAGPFVFRPAVVGDSVYAASRDGTVVRLAAANGAPRWRVSAGGMLSGGVGSDGKFVVVGTDKGEVIALDAGTGTVRWRARVSSEVLAAPEVAEGLALVRSADSRIFAFGLEDGKRRWVYQRAAAALVVRSPAGMIVRQGNVYAGFAGGKLVAISLANGAARWEATVALPKGATELERVTDIAGDPAAIGREVCAAAYQGRVACYELVNGNQLWARDMSTFTGVSTDARHAYVSDDRGTLHAFDRSNGRTLWKQDRLAHRRLSLPIAVGNEVAVGDFQGYVHFVARASGEVVSRAATDGSAILASPQRIPGGLLVQTQNGGLYAIAAAP
ncbi:MAG: outer membrane protein assembly factor BamB [Burkholderiales bacterium]